MPLKTKVCVIGAGPSGISAAKNCLQYELDVVVFEKNDKVGGNWVFNAKTGHSSVYNNTHIISSKTWSEYEDFPMPEEYPDYPNHKQLQSYFENYAKHFGVMDKIRFEHKVTKVTRNDDDSWTLNYRDQNDEAHVEIFSHLMVANGHHWNPKYPSYEGEFNGEMLHSHDFKGIDDSWRDKRVLVIGAGNSACDVAVESARVAKKVVLSMRSPQWFIPKFMFGQPSDVVGARTRWLPAKIKQYMVTLLLKMYQGNYKNYGLPQPKNLALSHHPTANSDLLDFIRHGRIHPYPAVEKLDGGSVIFSDGAREDFDIIIACTGFSISFPFFNKNFIDFENSAKVPLYRKMMHEHYNNLYFIGLFQPLGCIWPLADYQARIACQEILGNYKRPKDMHNVIQYEMENPHYKFEGGSRHSTQVDYHAFRNELKKELKKAGIDIGKKTKAKI